GASAIDPTDMIGAFVGDELLCMAQPVVIPGQDAPVAFLMVHGVTTDETIQFRVFDADRSEILNVADEIRFEVDKAVGSVASPVVLNARLVRTPDFNADGTVAFADFLMFSQMFGKDQNDDGFDGRFDLNDDGAVNFPDFVVLSQAFGNPVAAKTAFSNAQTNVESGVNEKVKLSLHPKPGTKSDEVHVMVRVGDAEALQGYGFRVVYDPSVLTFVSATSANPSQFATNLAPALAVNNIPGELLLADMLDMEAEGESDLVQLTFQSLDGNAGSFIEILDAMVSDRAGALNELLGVHLDDVRPIPSDFGLAQNRPNPFNPETVIDYQLPEAGNVLLVIYNVLGQEVVRLVQAHQVAGYYHITWDGRDESRRQVSSGVYFYRLMMGDVGLTHKMVLLK
ncbi:MAG: T9SS type A sorting domain-containing protein, partial [Candidatus Latescibacterota bacterium]